jgi:asparagine synthase (glutamine-hydrolysing)
MCGIAGILTTRQSLDIDPVLTSMVRALRHRGPDDEGTEILLLPGGIRLGLAHTRLSIIDLSAAGHQPMTDPGSGSWITYNGEVYNHQAVRRQLRSRSFRSSSDTETILTGWIEQGDRILHSLRGMFAFALYDGRRHEFWLVRDRLGIKPLYASQVDADTWIFASELRTVLASGLVPRRLRAEAVDSYLAFGAIPAPWTMLEGVVSLMPGECWRFSLASSAGYLIPLRRRYWQPPFRSNADLKTTHLEAAERLRPVLDEAAALRMVADVPVGIFLSGGIDSSSVVATLANQGHKLHTFAVVFGERAFNESRYACTVARQFETEHTELVLSPEQVLDEFDLALGAYDQPSIDGVNSYFISQTTRHAGIKVALSGLGGDELFAGYSYFRWLARLAQPLARPLAHLTHAVLRRIRPRSTRASKLGAILEGDGSRLCNYAICRQLMAGPQRATLFAGSSDGAHETLPVEVREDLVERTAGLDPVNAHSLLELSLYLANMLLRDIDQMSMAHALEVREPLLDHVLVEEVARLPGALKLEPGRHRCTKSLLVDALPIDLPNRLLHRPKMGVCPALGALAPVRTERPHLEADWRR